ncbi:hypothetical protein Bbelb_307170 [Branchiostoma belcheri]|nr:hypothetical protein Bbelb_307170 [Branchiostoma belcheri]
MVEELACVGLGAEGLACVGPGVEGLACVGPGAEEPARVGPGAEKLACVDPGAEELACVREASWERQSYLQPTGETFSRTDPLFSTLTGDEDKTVLTRLNRICIVYICPGETPKYLPFDTPTRRIHNQTRRHQLMRTYGTEDMEGDRTKTQEVKGTTEAKEVKVTDSTAPQGHDPLTADISREYEEHLQKGEEAVQRGDLDSAEKHFAAALRLVHVRDPTASQYAKEVSPLHKLGDVYCRRGCQTGDGGDFVKAAALYHAALARSKVHNETLKKAIVQTEVLFLKHALKKGQNRNQDETEKHKKQLKKTREQVKLEMESLDEDFPLMDDNEDNDDEKKDPLVEMMEKVLPGLVPLHEELETYFRERKVKEMEAKRADAVRQLFDKIAEERKEFIGQLINECISVMGPPPCKYALLGLGSQATGLVTPYSDLEFAILVEEENGANTAYFRRLTHYLHLKVVNLGETILPALGIKSLNDFYSDDPLDNWFYDSVTPRGFAFDGSMPKASKTPLGRGETAELIHTPSAMTKIMLDDLNVYFKEGYHLASILGNVSLITGEQDLVDAYCTLWTQKPEPCKGALSKSQALSIMGEDTNIQMFSPKAPTSRLIDVKKEIYRFSTLAVSCWALLRGIQPTTIWETIQNMNRKGVVNNENAHHLMVLVSISAELRLRTYMNNRGQVENMSALSSMSDNTDMGEKLRKVFYFSNTKQLMRYHTTAMPLKSFVSYLIEIPPPPIKAPVLFDNSPKVQAEVYLSLFDYKQAKLYAELSLQREASIGEKKASLQILSTACSNLGDRRKAVSYREQLLQMEIMTHGENTEHPHIAKSLNNLGNAWLNLGDHRKALSYYEQALQMRRSIHGEDTPHPDIATSLNNLGALWGILGGYRKAVSYFEQSLQTRRSIYGEDTEHPNIAGSLHKLGDAWSYLGDYRKAVSYYEQALQMRRKIHGEDTPHPDIADSLNKLGTAWSYLGDHRKAISYTEQSLLMRQSIYGEDTAHPDIVKSLNNLGNAWCGLGDYSKAVGYYEQSLQMRRSIHGEDTPHPDIAKSLNNLGALWGILGGYRKAVSYFEQSLQMWRSIYGEETEHPDIVNSLNNLGAAWSYLGDYRKAVSYYEQALQMRRKIHGEDTEQPDIAASLNNNLGSAWSNLGDHRKAVGYYKQALQMSRSIYGENTPHPHIAASLDNLGLALGNLGNYQKAVSYSEQSLQMRRSIYGEDTEHPDIAKSLNSLGTAWRNLGDHRKAVSYFEQSLQIRRKVYGQDNEHPDIATSLNSLGNSWSGLGDHRNAVSYYEKSLQMRRSIYCENTEHPDVAKSLNNLGAAWGNLGDYQKAVSFFEQSMEMFRSVFGPAAVHNSIAITLRNLSLSWAALGNEQEATEYRNQAEQMEKKLAQQQSLSLV